MKIGGVNVLKVFTSLSTDKKQLTTKDSNDRFHEIIYSNAYYNKRINIFNVSFCIHFREKRHVKIYLHSFVFVIL